MSEIIIKEIPSNYNIYYKNIKDIIKIDYFYNVFYKKKTRVKSKLGLASSIDGKIIIGSFRKTLYADSKKNYSKEKPEITDYKSKFIKYGYRMILGIPYMSKEEISKCYKLLIKDIKNNKEIGDDYKTEHLQILHDIIKNNVLDLQI